MKIEAIDIQGFGRWSHAQFLDLANFQIFTGGNEAGKSTLRAFIIGVLFGFPSKTKDKNIYLPKNGEGYGGSLTVALPTGRYEISRMGRKPSTLRVSRLSDHTAIENPQSWLDQVLAPVDLSTYQAVFSFDHQALAEVRRLAPADLQRLLLSLGAPRASDSLNQAQQLETAASQQFARSKTGKRPLNQMVRAYRQGETALQQLVQQIPSYQEGQKSLAADQGQVIDLQTQLDQLRKRTGELQSLVHLYPLYQEAQKVNQANSTNHLSIVSREDFYRAQQISENLDHLDDDQSNDDNPNQAADQPVPSEAWLALSNQLPAIRRIIEERRRLMQNEESLNNQFQGPRPAAITASEETALRQYRPLQWGAVLASILTGWSAWRGQFSGLTIILGLATVVLVFLAFRRRGQVQRVLAAYAPLGAAETLAMQSRLRQLARAQAQQAADQDSQAQLDYFASQLGQLCQEYGLGIDTSDLLGTYQSLSQVIQIRSQVNQRMQAERTAVLQESVQSRAALSQELSELLQHYQVSDLAQLRSRMIQGENQGRNQQRWRDLKGQIGDQNWTALADYSDLDSLQGQLAAVTGQVQDLEQKIQILGQTIAEKKAQQNQLIDGDQYGQALQQQADRAASLTDAFRQYLGNQLAAKTILTTLNRLTQQRWPAMQAQAQEYFQDLTDGHYQTIDFAPEQIQVISQEGQRFDIFELSTGTRDQLYVALRLALVMNLAGQIDLPLIIDDGFLNFDQDRSDKMISLLTRIAEQHQVIYLTKSHPVNRSAKIFELKKVSPNHG
ncbi:AAA family ATPase [Leuconostocaceae bacterium ESL0723]|nr:AAA family ATPase [Leuconostocaceae bacterium ESL0723]